LPAVKASTRASSCSPASSPTASCRPCTGAAGSSSSHPCTREQGSRSWRRWPVAPRSSAATSPRFRRSSEIREPCSIPSTRATSPRRWSASSETKANLIGSVPSRPSGSATSPGTGWRGSRSRDTSSRWPVPAGATAGSGRRKRLAIFTPWPPDPTPMATYSMRLAERLADRADVDVDRRWGARSGRPVRPRSRAPGQALARRRLRLGSRAALVRPDPLHAGELTELSPLAPRALPRPGVVVGPMTFRYGNLYRALHEPTSRSGTTRSGCGRSSTSSMGPGATGRAAPGGDRRGSRDPVRHLHESGGAGPRGEDPRSLSLRLTPTRCAWTGFRASREPRPWSCIAESRRRPCDTTGSPNRHPGCGLAWGGGGCRGDRSPRSRVRGVGRAAAEREAGAARRAREGGPRAAAGYGVESGDRRNALHPRAAEGRSLLGDAEYGECRRGAAVEDGRRGVGFGLRLSRRPGPDHRLGGGLDAGDSGSRRAARSARVPPAELTAGIDRAIDDDDLRVRIRAAQEEYAVENSYDRVAERYLELLGL